ncbi:VWA containing CoxE family protein [Cylindrospermopsis raciborskii]|uniref:VWA containing CoxE family protein n=1 Tax=Cylindrospermopsis raciborskii CENA302 TaxID=1170768 RepID=A0A9Q5W9Y8_9CYAN|nr:VWA containing CoxE family protein [Cylindrospermopsis raciborskii]MCZ2207669.1 VWA containing CoxE family protein [Cylindrospermopsis raciborskii PAMP2011]OPH10180.1 VWA containing CoxE family protein [Cylindrospermopsis raciborskii CENA302]
MFQPELYLKTLFYRLREDGFNLSIREYFSALDAIARKWKPQNKKEEETQNPEKENFKTLLCLLWCKSREQQDHLKLIFDTIVVESEETEKTIEKESKTRQKDVKNDQIKSDSPLTSSASTSIETIHIVTKKPTIQDLSALPVTTPQAIQEYDNDDEFNTHYPISRRFMVYSWRYLRRPIADGVRDVLDINMTVEEATKQGFFLQPVYQRREKNHAHLLILVDQEGSMTPFHHFSKDLVETAQYESSIEKVDVVYFHNLPAEYIYQNRFLTNKVALKTVLSQCDSETRVLIVSDGGAARGYRRGERISTTIEVISEIQQHTNLIAWLNPVPQPRWNSTSAKIISHLVPMFPMNQEGLIQAIATLQR